MNKKKLHFLPGSNIHNIFRGTLSIFLDLQNYDQKDEYDIKNFKYSYHAEENCIYNCKNKKILKKSYMVECRIGCDNNENDDLLIDVTIDKLFDNLPLKKFKYTTIVDNFFDNTIKSKIYFLKNKPFLIYKQKNKEIIYTLKKAIPCNECASLIIKSKIPNTYFSI